MTTYGYINGHPYGDRSSIGVKTYRVPVGSSEPDIFLPLQDDVGVLLVAAMREFHNRVEPLREGWCWGYADRSVRGSTAPSFHWAAIAVDANAPKHPLGKSGTFSRRQVDEINRICRKYGLRWGGNYNSRKDEMHFEIIISRTEALALVRKLQAPLPTIKRGTRRWRAVLRLRRRLHAHGTKINTEIRTFGATLETQVKAFQRKRHLKADGVVGPKTWEYLLKRP